MSDPVWQNALTAFRDLVWQNALTAFRDLVWQNALTAFRFPPYAAVTAENWPVIACYS
jgi:hypothetical protein